VFGKSSSVGFVGVGSSGLSIVSVIPSSISGV